LLYGAACSLGEQVERLYARVSRDRVYVLLLEDLKKDPRQAYIDVLAFLGVSDDGRVDFEAHNVAKRMASRIIFRGVRVMGRVKRVLGVRRGLGVLKALNQFNMRVQPWARLSPAMTGELTAYFRDDVEKLAALIERDLSHWSRPKSASGKEPGNFRMGAGLGHG
jgi:hypothetical protein